MTARHLAFALTVGLALSAGGDVVWAQAPSSSAGSAPTWLDEDPASRVSTRHLVAEAEALGGRVPADGRVTLVLHVTPKPGMRIYAHDVSGYVPFALQLDPGATVSAARTAYPSSAWYEFPPTRERSRVYQDAVTIRQPVVLSAAVRRALDRGEKGRVRATVRYQACDDRLCYRPEDVRIAW